MSDNGKKVKVYFSDFFNVDPKMLENYGAFNISLINDLPLFIDPFLIFNSKNPKYKQLHDEIIRYVSFLRDKAIAGQLNDGLLSAWFTFPEIKQNWLGFSETGNQGRGLGTDFAQSLRKNLHTIFSDFGKEKIAKGSHLEKLCLIRDGVGRDNISDFTANLIKGYLLSYTETFAKTYLNPSFIRKKIVKEAFFNYETEYWAAQEYELPYIFGDYVILTPRDILTRDDIWINKGDLYNDWERILGTLPNEQLRAQVNNYFISQLPKPKKDKKEPTKEEISKAITDALSKFPTVIDTYIALKEKGGDEAERQSIDRVIATEKAFIEQLSTLISILLTNTAFYREGGDTFEEARQRVGYLKTVIEDMDGYRIFYLNGKPIHREKDIHVMFKLTWFGAISDVNAETNNGRGPVDFAISRGAFDKTLVEFKLASNSHLEKNLKKQLEVYGKANRTKKGLKVILFFSEKELEKLRTILKELKLENDPNIILIDARSDNKPSGSKA